MTWTGADFAHGLTMMYVSVKEGSWGGGRPGISPLAQGKELIRKGISIIPPLDRTLLVWWIRETSWQTGLDEREREGLGGRGDRVTAPDDVEVRENCC